MTPSTVSIQVPAIDDDTDLVAFFEEQLRDDVGDLHGDFFRAIDTDVSIHNDRAVLEDVVIENVEVETFDSDVPIKIRQLTTTEQTQNSLGLLQDREKTIQQVIQKKQQELETVRLGIN